MASSKDLRKTDAGTTGETGATGSTKPDEKVEEPTATCELLSAFQERDASEISTLKDLAVMRKVLSEEECEKVIHSVERMGMKPLRSQFPLRKTRRIVIDSGELAEAVWKRVEPHIPFREVRDDFGDIWHLSGLNERFRFCSYGKGDDFKAHCDGYWQSSYRRRSFATLMIYLNNVDDEIGGSTRFLGYGMYVRPRAGNAVVFLTDDLLHDGEEIRNVDDNVYKAEKYIMRTDVMYECKKFRNSDIRKRIYEMREEAYRCQEEGKDTRAVELWEQIINLEHQLKTMNLAPKNKESAPVTPSAEPQPEPDDQPPPLEITVTAPTGVTGPTGTDEITEVRSDPTGGIDPNTKTQSVSQSL